MWLLCESLAYLSCHCPKPNDGLKKVAGGGRFSSFIIDSWLIYLGVDFSKQCEIGSQATLQKTFIWPYYTNNVNSLCKPIYFYLWEYWSFKLYFTH